MTIPKGSCLLPPVQPSAQVHRCGALLRCTDAAHSSGDKGEIYLEVMPAPTSLMKAAAKCGIAAQSRRHTWGATPGSGGRASASVNRPRKNMDPGR